MFGGVCELGEQESAVGGVADVARMCFGFGFGGVGVPGAVDSRVSGEGVDFETGVVGQAGQAGPLGIGQSLERGVVFEGGAGFGRFREREAEVVEPEHFDGEVVEEGAKFGDFAGVLCGEEDLSHGACSLLSSAMRQGERNRDEIAQSAARALREAGAQIGGHRALVGFDGFIDIIMRVVDRRRTMRYEDYESIRTIEAFSRRIGAAAGKSANIELVTLEQRFGGNGPLLAGALGQLGLSVAYVGAVGREEDHRSLHPIFEPFAKRCREVHPIGPPSVTEALEFDDGKLMLGHARNSTLVTWDEVKRAVGVEKVRELVQSASLVGIVNWTMVGGVEGIWNGLCDEMLVRGGQQRIFIDLSDPAKRLDEDLGRGLGILSRMAGYGRVTLGLNLAEAQRVSRVLGTEAGGGGHEALRLAELIRGAMSVDCVVVHRRDGAAAATECGRAEWFDGPFTRNPLLSTGAGDHFNSGFALGQVLGLDIDECLAVACGVSGLYVREGVSPTAERLAMFLDALPLPEGSE